MKPRHVPTAIGLLLCVGLGVFFWALVVRPRETQNATVCWGYSSNIMGLVHGYAQFHGHLPPAYLADAQGKPMHSWRILILDFLGDGLYEQYRFDEPWDGPNNRLLESKMPNFYACPSDQASRAKYHTNYLAVTGPNTAFPGAKGVRLEDITRPHAETILVVESINSGVHWMEPRDLDFETMSFLLNDPSKPSISSRHANRGPAAVWADWHFERLRDQTPDQMREMLTIRPGS